MSSQDFYPHFWINGRHTDEASAVLSAGDHGFLLGDGIFETMHWDGEAVRWWARHWERFLNSANHLGLHVPEKSVLEEALEALVKANHLVGQPARLRLTLSSGPGPAGLRRKLASMTCLLSASPWMEFRDGLVLKTLPWARQASSPLTGMKTLSQMENVMAFAEARRLGADEGLFRDSRNGWCEGCTSNVFFLIEQEWRTPPLNTGCLPGVMRSVLLEAARRVSSSSRVEWGRMEVPRVVEKPVLLDHLLQVQALCLTSALRGVQFASELDGVKMQISGSEMEALKHLVQVAWAQERSSSMMSEKGKKSIL